MSNLFDQRFYRDDGYAKHIEEACKTLLAKINKKAADCKLAIFPQVDPRVPTGAGKALGMFIEGGIVGPGEVSETKDGVAMLALKTGAKVIPVHISGTKNSHSIGQGLLARHRARVRYGKPVDLDDVRRAGKGKKIKMLGVTHGESSTSVMHDLDALPQSGRRTGHW